MSVATNGSRQTMQGVGCGVGAGALWGFTVLAPELVNSFAPVTIAAGRYPIYGLVSAILVAPRWWQVSSLLTKREWQLLFALALLGKTIFYILVALAVQGGGVAMTSLVLGFLPVIVASVGSRNEMRYR